MKTIKTQDAVGHILCHDLTQIIKDEFKGPRFKKGHIIQKEDIPVLLSMGKENLYVFELEEGMLHENEAALRLCNICKNEYMAQSDVNEGKIELKAETDGLFTVDSKRLEQINSIDELMIATRHSNTVVKKGDKLCGTRVIPLVINESKIAQAEQIFDNEPILKITQFTLKKAGIITTGSEVSITVTKHLVVDDGISNIINAINEMRNTDIEMIICTGGMSVDPDDNTPGAIKQSGAEIITYGAPVLPGAMFLLGYFDNLPIVGLPGCAMYAKATVFDLALPKLAAKVKMTKKDFIKMGEGGLCLSCDVCNYPVCPFGK